MVMDVYIESGCGIELWNRRMIQVVQSLRSRLPLITFLLMLSIQKCQFVYMA